MGTAWKLSDEQVRVATNMRAHNVNWTLIARHFGVAPDTVRRRIDPTWRTRRNAMIAACTQERIRNLR